MFAFQQAHAWELSTAEIWWEYSNVQIAQWVCSHKNLQGIMYFFHYSQEAVSGLLLHPWPQQKVKKVLFQFDSHRYYVWYNLLVMTLSWSHFFLNTRPFTLPQTFSNWQTKQRAQNTCTEMFRWLSVCVWDYSMSIHDIQVCTSLFILSWMWVCAIGRTHVNVRERLRSEVIGSVRRITSGTAEDRRRGERRKREDALLQLINQRLLAWK